MKSETIRSRIGLLLLVFVALLAHRVAARLRRADCMFAGDIPIHRDRF